MKIFKHIKLVMKHKWIVFKLCCKIGMPWRGYITKEETSTIINIG